MATKEDLPAWVVAALKEENGRARQVAKRIWERHEHDLRNSGELFYTWQYDTRWPATYLRKTGVMKSEQMSTKGIWELA